jgi:elongation factor P
MATTADFKNGMCMEFNGKLYTIVQFQHVKLARGAHSFEQSSKIWKQAR